MNKLFATFLVLVCSAFFSSLSYAEMSIIGKWSGIDSDGDSASFVFNEDNSAEVKFEDVPPLTSENLANGSVEWSRNTEYDPMHLDILILIDSQNEQRIPMIAQFIDDQTLKIQLSRDMKSRPKAFEMTKDVFQILATKQ
jgi:hypothetical protein